MSDITPASGGQWRLLMRPHEPRWCRSYCHSGRPYGPTYGAWWATRRAPCTNTREKVARSLKMNMAGTACRDANMDRSFPMWTRSREAKSVTSMHSAGEGTKTSPGIRSGKPYTTSANAALKSSFLALRILNRAKGRNSAQSSSPRHITAAFS